MTSRVPAAALRSAFEDIGYRVDDVVHRIGDEAHRALHRNQTVPASRALGTDRDPLATLVRLWLLQYPVQRADLDRALPGLVDELVAARVIEADGDEVRATLDLRPYAGEDGADTWIASDLTPGLDHRPIRLRDDHVLGVSSASSTLALISARRPVGTALDLGVGCGVQTLHLCGHAERVIATDLNPRALDLTRITMALNGAEADLRHGDLYRPLGDELVDQIVSNPPYVMSPPSSAHLTYREAGRDADDLVRDVVVGGARRLAPGGSMQVLANWAHLASGDWEDRVASWFEGLGCTVRVVQREALEPSEYVELWLADAGLTGTDGYRRYYHEWVDYLDAQGISAIGMGWVFADRVDDSGGVAVEHWPHPVALPLAEELDRRRAQAALLAGDDSELLSRRLVRADDVVQESTGTPGLPDPHRVVLRQHRGFMRAHAVSTALAAVVGACDGELRLAQIIDAVAHLLDADAGHLRTETLPHVRTLIGDGLLGTEAAQDNRRCGC